MTIHEFSVSDPLLRPRITLSAEDHKRLSALVHAASNRLPDLASELEEELGRAEVVANGAPLGHVVSMGSHLEYRDETTGKLRKITLVYPASADISEGKVSVLTPIGTALIGLHAGASMTWETPAGETRRLTVIRIAKSPASPQHE